MVLHFCTKRQLVNDASIVQTGNKLKLYSQFCTIIYYVLYEKVASGADYSGYRRGNLGTPAGSTHSL